MKGHKNTKLQYTGILLWCTLIITAGFFMLDGTKAAAQQSYTVKPSSTTFQNHYQTSKTYNEKTKQYYMLRSYLEQLEKDGGGTLVISKGIYEITNTLYVPSHVIILLKDGAVLRKSKETGTTLMKAASSMFQLAAPSKSKIAGAYSGYNGETDIKLIGEGSAAIDLNYTENAIGIMFGHNTQVTVSGIHFCNMRGGHFIELDASRTITIENNIFQDCKPSSTRIKEAINVDTPDLKTGGFHAVWTSYDCTPNQDVLIQKNTFRNLERAIGTHKYSDGKYHENIQIVNNVIENTSSDAIRIINWKAPVITGNSITDVNHGEGTVRAILVSGISHPVIRDNIFTNAPRPIQLMPWKNNGTGSEYAITYNEVDSQEISMMLTNTLVRVREPFIRENHIYGVYSTNTTKYNYSAAYMR